MYRLTLASTEGLRGSGFGSPSVISFHCTLIGLNAAGNPECGTSGPSFDPWKSEGLISSKDGKP